MTPFPRPAFLRLRRYGHATLAALAVIAGITGIAAAGETPAPRRSLTIGLIQYPNTLHPSINSMLAKSYVLGFARRPITAYDPEWNLVCMLCSELPTFENGGAVREAQPDGSMGVAVTYRLDPKAQWGDGVPISADDVIFTWEVGRHPQSGVANFELFQRITKIERLNSKAFTLHFDKLTFEYNAINDFQLLPAHLERQVFEEDPVSYQNRTLYDTKSTTKGLFMGPYRIAEVASGRHFILLPNEKWWGKKPFFDRIILKIIENTAALEANLRSGAIDYIPGELGLTLDQALAFEKRFPESYRIIYKPGLIFEHIDLNLDNPILADRRVRRALLYAIDREAISQQLFAGRQPVARSFVNPLDWVHASDLPRYPFDPAAAGRLLDEAGWTLWKNGIRYRQDGTRLTLEFMTSAGDRTREMVQQVLQSQWRGAGIDVRIRNLPARVLFANVTNRRQFSAMVMFAWFTAPENVPRTILHSSMIPRSENNWSGQNFTGFSDPEMDRLIDEVEITLERPKRRALWKRMQEIYMEKLPVLPLYFRASPYVMPLWLKGVRPTGHQYPTTLWVEDWYAE